MLSSQSLVNPYVRRVPDGKGNMIAFMATHVDPSGRIEWDNGTLRPMTDEERAELVGASHATQMSPEAIEAAHKADLWLRELKREKQEACSNLVSEIGEIAAQAAAEAKQRAATAACGIESDPNPMPCTDEQEAACQWGLKGCVSLGAKERIAYRPEKCPRKLLQLSERRGAMPMDVKIARGRKAGIPEMYLARFAQKLPFEDREALVAVRKFKDDLSKQFLILLGTNQCGKTFAAARWLLEQESGLFASHDDLRLAMMPGDKTDLERRTMQAQALVLDNIEASMSPALRQRVEGLFVKHHAAGRRMVVTSSMDMATFLDKMKPEGANTGPAHARLANGIALGSVVMAECPSWG